ncbi:MAG TPA: serine/threonine-protein kinase [Polyangiaceae bacterium]|nr:serine/threonine-protein kinase [Polyangiaceae bacterium]
MTLAESDTLPGGSRLGTTIAGKYRLERLLGRGGMGEVYEARHVVVGRRFAVKLLHSHAARGHDATVSRFLREARAAGALDSPHIVAVVDFDTADDGSPFLVMEYLPGESLAALLAREGSLPMRRALPILLQVCEGLEVAHRAGIVHRDLKPDNLFITRQRDGTELIKILDFGIAKLVDPDASGSVTQSGAVLGTPFYMAPEQARGEKSVDWRVDVYALGVLAYELLSGEKPHPGDGYNAILAHILTQPRAPLAELRPELPPALVEVVERALAFEPARRPPSAAALARELEPFGGAPRRIDDAHFDLRPPTDVASGLVTQATSSAPEPSNGGTLASAVGDVQRAGGARRWPWLVLAVSCGAVALLVLKSRDGSPPATHEDPVSAALSAAATAPTERSEPVAPVAGSASASASMSPRPRASPAKLRPNLSASAVRTRSAPREVTFDENNPY